MKVNVFKINNQLTVVGEDGLYLGNIREVDDQLMGNYYKGDYFDLKNNSVYCSFINDKVLNVVISIAQYHQLKITESEVEFIDHKKDGLLSMQS